MTDKLTFDFDAVTPRMLVDFKAKTGTSLMSLVNGDEDDADSEPGEIEFDLSKMDEELIAGFIWLALRMSGKPDATWDEALDTPFTSLDFVDEDGEPDPSSASSES